MPRSRGCGAALLLCSLCAVGLPEAFVDLARSAQPKGNTRKDQPRLSRRPDEEVFANPQQAASETTLGRCGGACPNWFVLGVAVLPDPSWAQKATPSSCCDASRRVPAGKQRHCRRGGCNNAAPRIGFSEGLLLVTSCSCKKLRQTAPSCLRGSCQ